MMTYETLLMAWNEREKVRASWYYHSGGRKEEDLKRLKKLYQNRKKKVINLYGSKCMMCGETDPWVFEFHHKKGNSKINETTRKILLRISENGFDPNIELLCANCHKKANIIDDTRRGGKYHQ